MPERMNEKRESGKPELRDARLMLPVMNVDPWLLKPLNPRPFEPSYPISLS